GPMRKFTNDPAMKIMFRILRKPLDIRTARVHLGAAALMLLAVVSAHAQSVQEGQALFGTKCYSCHNVGSGDKTGPDLKGVTTRRTKDWLHEFVNGPAAMNAKGDAAAKQLFGRFGATVMPDQGLTPAQIDSILMMIEELSNKNEIFVPAGAKLSRAIGPADVDGGWQLFTGRTRLQNGGAACISCHSIKGVGQFGGGTLGPDLTGANLKYRDPELIAILQNPNFPTMSTIFGGHALTAEEIVQLFALLQNAKINNPAPATQAGVASLDPRFFITGVAAMLLILTLLNLAWRNRLRGVREQLVRKATK
ncbi:MAG TPA: c-type cytochrome, partial [Pyrinomonadaceae bacterium]|nr:c-type cytochrome [Pyrinomonadaceae bacterium]